MWCLPVLNDGFEADTCRHFRRQSCKIQDVKMDIWKLENLSCFLGLWNFRGLQNAWYRVWGLGLSIPKVGQAIPRESYFKCGYKSPLLSRIYGNTHFPSNFFYKKILVSLGSCRLCRCQM